MTVLVLDASMTITWFFEDEGTTATDSVMTRVVGEGALVPSLWRLEVANVFRNAVRRGRCDNAFADEALSRLDRLMIEIDDQTDRQAWRMIRILSQEENLTMYDAAYLELALRRQLPLATCDRDLAAAARRRSIATLTA